MDLNKASERERLAYREAQAALSTWRAAAGLQSLRSNILERDYRRAVSRHLKAAQALDKAAMAHLPKAADIYRVARLAPEARFRQLVGLRTRLKNAVAFGAQGPRVREITLALDALSQPATRAVRPPGESF